MPRKSLDSRARSQAETCRRNGRPSGLRASVLIGLGVLLTLSLQPQQAEAQSPSRVNLARATESSTNSCSARGEIHGLDPRGDGFLAVRTGPSVDQKQVDELHNGDVVLLCDYRNGWHRVVYPGAGQRTAECSMSSAQKPEPMSDRCRSGWVHGNWVKWVSGW